MPPLSSEKHNTNNASRNPRGVLGSALDSNGDASGAVPGASCAREESSDDPRNRRGPLHGCLRVSHLAPPSPQQPYASEAAGGAAADCAFSAASFWRFSVAISALANCFFFSYHSTIVFVRSG